MISFIYFKDKEIYEEIFNFTKVLTLGIGSKLKLFYDYCRKDQMKK